MFLKAAFISRSGIFIAGRHDYFCLRDICAEPVEKAN
jgi:hypothetical protein